MTKALKKKYNPIPTLQDNNNTAITDKEKAEMLANQFIKAHSIELTHNTFEQEHIIETVLDFLRVNENEKEKWTKFMTSPKEVTNVLKGLTSLKAPGPDKIQNIILKNLSKKAIVQLMYIINSMFKMSYFPQQWKIAHIIPIAKPGKPDYMPSCYRPVSLLPTLAKVTEKIILTRIQKHEKNNNIIIKQQFGFRQKHNTLQQIIRITNDIVTGFNKKKVTTMLLLDIEKAFDKVWIDGLIYKLIQNKYPTTIIKLIYSYMRSREFRVTINGILTEHKSIPAGVPQGSILGPALFNIYLNDIEESSKTNLALYADDTAIYAQSFHAVVAAKQIQMHITKL